MTREVSPILVVDVYQALGQAWFDQCGDCSLTVSVLELQEARGRVQTMLEV